MNRKWLRSLVSAINGFVSLLAGVLALYMAGVPFDVRSSASGHSLDAPIIILLLSVAIVCGFRSLDGRFAIFTSKHRLQLSSSATSVLLWALCFSLISVFALLNGLLLKGPQAPSHREPLASRATKI